jgi:hypothetical protein
MLFLAPAAAFPLLLVPPLQLPRPDPPPPTASAEPGPEARLGLALVGMPKGWIKVYGSEAGYDGDTRPALGLRGTADHQSGHFLVGLGVALTFNVQYSKWPGSSLLPDSAGFMTDILVRLGGSTRGKGLNFYAYAAPGASIVSLPNRDSSSGLALGLHAGLRRDLGERMFWNVEAGPQLAVQQPQSFNYLQVTFGLGWRHQLKPWLPSQAPRDYP